MDELKEIRKELKEFRKSVIRLSWAYKILPDTLPRIDWQDLLDEIKYLCGYVDCMIDRINHE